MWRAELKNAIPTPVDTSSRVLRSRTASVRSPSKSAAISFGDGRPLASARRSASERLSAATSSGGMSISRAVVPVPPSSAAEELVDRPQVRLLGQHARDLQLPHEGIEVARGCRASRRRRRRGARAARSRTRRSSRARRRCRPSCGRRGASRSARTRRLRPAAPRRRRPARSRRGGGSWRSPRTAASGGRGAAARARRSRARCRRRARRRSARRAREARARKARRPAIVSIIADGSERDPRASRPGLPRRGGRRRGPHRRRRPFPGHDRRPLRSTGCR